MHVQGDSVCGFRGSIPGTEFKTRYLPPQIAMTKSKSNDADDESAWHSNITMSGISTGDKIGNALDEIVINVEEDEDDAGDKGEDVDVGGVTKEPETTERNEVAADGGVEIDDYDLTPEDFEAQISNKWRDTVNAVSTHLVQVADSDVWICYRRWQEGPNQYGTAIKGIGNITVDALSLDRDKIAEHIRSEVEVISSRGDLDDYAESLSNNADALAEAVASVWESAAENIIHDGIYEGDAHVDRKTAWASHVEEAMYYEADRAVTDVGVDDVQGIATDIVRKALYEIVKGIGNSRQENVDYIATLEFEASPWKIRALELRQNGVFSAMPRTAEVQALRESDRSQSEIADLLGMDPSTVSQHSTRADDVLGRAQ